MVEDIKNSVTVFLKVLVLLIKFGTSIVLFPDINNNSKNDEQMWFIALWLLFRSHLLSELIFILSNSRIAFLLVSVEEKKERTLQNILNAKNKIRYEISDLKERVKLAKETIVKFKAEITKLQANTPGSGSVS